MIVAVLSGVFAGLAWGGAWFAYRCARQAREAANLALTACSMAASAAEACGLLERAAARGAAASRGHANEAQNALARAQEVYGS